MAGHLLPLSRPADYPGRFAIKAVEVCGKRQTCLVYGWDKAERVPVAVTEARPAGVLFAYSHRGDEQKAMWDCTRIKRDKPDQCCPARSPASIRRWLPKS
ncbi:Uncharacterised protein [Sphingomonas paucimobilis]|nr:Uncharacterised protein [Sphingomonas paucimobilis]